MKNSQKHPVNTKTPLGQSSDKGYGIFRSQAAQLTIQK